MTGHNIKASAKSSELGIKLSNEKMEELETSIMSQDQHALRDAYNLVEKHGEGRIGYSKLIKKLEKIADRLGVSERTSLVIRFAIEKCKEGSMSYAWRILFEEWQKQI